MVRKKQPIFISKIILVKWRVIDDNLKPAISWLKNWGLEVVIGSTIGLDNNQLAGTDEQRAADFQTQRFGWPTIRF